MYHMMLLVLDKLEQSHAVLEAWEAAGASGITILESTGLARIRESVIRDDLPLIPSIASLMASREEHHHTFFSVVEGESQVDRLIDATLKITGDLDEADSGVLFVLPVHRAIGLKGAQRRVRGNQS
jgi:nitrogen regulatory protein PII